MYWACNCFIFYQISSMAIKSWFSQMVKMQIGPFGSETLLRVWTFLYYLPVYLQLPWENTCPFHNTIKAFCNGNVYHPSFTAWSVQHKHAVLVFVTEWTEGNELDVRSIRLRILERCRLFHIVFVQPTVHFLTVTYFNEMGCGWECSIFNDEEVIYIENQNWIL